MSSDPEHVKSVLKAQSGEKEEYAPPLTEWTAQNEQLAGILDATRELIAVQISRAGAKPPKLKPSPRPRTGYEDARAGLAKEQHEQLKRKVLRKYRAVD